MIVLAFDSSAPVLTVGIAKDGRSLGRWDTPADRTRGGTLDALIESALREARLRRGDIEAIGLVTGPGSLTALRIGWATVTGWAITTGIPATGWSAAAVQKRRLGEDRTLAARASGKDVQCLVHHRGDEFYLYRLSQDTDIQKPSVVNRTAWPPVNAPGTFLLGPGLLHDYESWLRNLPDGAGVIQLEDAIVGGDRLAEWTEGDIRNRRTLDLTISPIDYGLPPAFRKVR